MTLMTFSLSELTLELDRYAIHTGTPSMVFKDSESKEGTFHPYYYYGRGTKYILTSMRFSSRMVSRTLKESVTRRKKKNHTL